MLANEIQKETKCYKACWLLKKKTDESNLITVTGAKNCTILKNGKEY